MIGPVGSTPRIPPAIASTPCRYAKSSWSTSSRESRNAPADHEPVPDVPAAVVAHLYRYRWQVELFFRWLKCCGNFNHLLSHSRDGVLMHFYVTIIATLLMYLHTGYRPSKYCFVLLSQVAVGAATLDEVLPILKERERQCELARPSRPNVAAQDKPQRAAHGPSTLPADVHAARISRPASLSQRNPHARALKRSATAMTLHIKPTFPDTIGRSMHDSLGNPRYYRARLD